MILVVLDMTPIRVLFGKIGNPCNIESMRVRPIEEMAGTGSIDLNCIRHIYDQTMAQEGVAICPGMVAQVIDVKKFHQEDGPPWFR